MSVLAAVAAALACWLVVGPPPLKRLYGRAPGGGSGTSALGRLLPPILALVVATVTGGLVGGGPGMAIGLAVALPVLTGALMWSRQRRRVVLARNAREVAAACQLLVGLLRVGHVPSSALRIAARDAPVLAEAAAMLEIGSAAAPVLRALGSGPGRSGLAELAAAWEVAEVTGASLTATLDALAERLAARLAVEQVVSAELSAPRATGRLLAVLPVAGVVLGYSFGGDPLAFLTGSFPGRVSLVAGVALGCVGVFWTERIADQGVD
jgi:tight adherence protein B